MGTFRALSTTLTCLRCGASYAVEVHFKTGNDHAMPVYGVGDLVDDVEPDAYDGIADAYCPACARRWVWDEKRAHFERLADEIAAGRVVARRARWRHGSLDGRPELGLVVTIDEAAAVTAGDIRTLCDSAEGFGWPTFTARLHDAELALWCGDERLHPHDPVGGAAAAAWWQRHYELVDECLRHAGWPTGASQHVDLDVLVDADHRVWLALPAPRAS